MLSPVSAAPTIGPSPALRRGADALVRMQRDDGSWEGECVWCPMLTAQYVMTAHVIGLEVSPERRRGILLHFVTTRNRYGVWGLHPNDEGNLFVTTLVYVAARLLGTSLTEPWLRSAREMFAHEGGVERIPSWGKAWLALLSLYEWEGVNPVLPEVWMLPPWVPVHPANYYCHTRSIYLGLAVVYGERLAAPVTPLIETLRAELYVREYGSIDFRAQANRVREADAPFRASPALRVIFGLSRRIEPLQPQRWRSLVLRRLRARM